jgi:hypothetical protein
MEPQPRKLLDRVRDAVRTRHYSGRTEEAYVHWIRRYIVFHKKTHPSQMGAAEISQFLTSLARRATRQRLHTEPGARRYVVSLQGGVEC